jgi:hypothetical protein
VAAILAAALVGTACSTPETVSGTLDEGRQQVTQLVLEAAHALPATVTFTPPTEVGTQPCRKTAFGYVIGRTGAHRAEVPLVVTVEPGTGPRLLGVLAAAWEKAGYDVDRSRIDEPGFPQSRATTSDGNTVVATAFARPADPPRINLYAVSSCLPDAAATGGPPTSRHS